MVYKFFDKVCYSQKRGINSENQQLADELQKPITRKF